MPNKCQKTAKNAHNDYSNCLFCATNSPKTQQYSVYQHIKQRKLANFNIWEAGTGAYLAFFAWKMIEIVAEYLPVDRLIDSSRLIVDKTKCINKILGKQNTTKSEYFRFFVKVLHLKVKN